MTLLRSSAERRESGRGDVVALLLALALAAAAVVPVVLARNRVRGGAEPAATGLQMSERDATLKRGREAEERLASRAVHAGLPRERRFGPPPPAPEKPPLRVTGLDGTVVDGRLRARWTPAPGSTGTLIRVEGLGGPGVLERIVAAGVDTFDAAVSPVAGTIVLRALPQVAEGAAAEDRVSIPFRVPVEILGVESASVSARSSMFILRRAYDGRPVEARFLVAESDSVGGLSSTGEGEPAVDFQTDYVLEVVRGRRMEEPRTFAVPEFERDGRVRRDARRAVVVAQRRDAPRVYEVPEVVLRGPGEERRILRAPSTEKAPR
jgi:hypothetical protein